MQDYESVSLNQLQTELESVSREIRQSKLRLVGQLLAASLLLILWFAAITPLKFDTFGPARFIMILPIYANVLAWAFWGYTQALTRFSLSPSSLSLSPSSHFESRHELARYDYLQFALRRQRRLEFPIDLTTAVQFVSMGATMLLLLPFFRGVA